MMEDRVKREAFRYALITVGVSALAVAGMFFYQARPHPESWRIYVPVVAATTLLVFPLVYFSYRGGAERRRKHMVLALAYVWFAILFLAARFMDFKTGNKTISMRLFAGFWLLLAMIQLYRAYMLYRAYRERRKLFRTR